MRRPLRAAASMLKGDYELLKVADAPANEAFGTNSPSSAHTARHFRLSDDPELGQENLCEMKHHMMTRNDRAGDIDRRLQPNSFVRDMLEAIIRVSARSGGEREDRRASSLQMPSLQPMLIEVGNCKI